MAENLWFISDLIFNRQLDPMLHARGSINTMDLSSYQEALKSLKFAPGGLGTLRTREE